MVGLVLGHLFVSANRHRLRRPARRSKAAQSWAGSAEIRERGAGEVILCGRQAHGRPSVGFHAALARNNPNSSAICPFNTFSSRPWARATVLPSITRWSYTTRTVTWPSSITPQFSVVVNGDNGCKD